jgi:Domain of unknown function DUF29
MDSLYDADFLLWSEQQAALLQRLAAGERVNDAVDWAHLIEEVGDLGRGQLQAVGSQLRVALAHLLLVHAASRPETVAHWRGEARTALANAADAYAPSMAQRIALAKHWRVARLVALDKLGDQGGPARPLPEACPFTLAELVQPEAELDALLARLGSA